MMLVKLIPILTWGLAVGLLAVSLAAEAQPAGKVYRIGYLMERPRLTALEEAFLQGLRDLGYAEGQNITIEYRFAEGRAERLPTLAAELLALKVDVIVTAGTPATLAAKRATATVPIVMASSPNGVADGLVASLARPGGNVTGQSLFAAELAPPPTSTRSSKPRSLATFPSNSPPSSSSSST